MLFRASIFSWDAEPPKTPAEGHQVPPDSPATLTLATLAFPMIMFTHEIMSEFD